MASLQLGLVRACVMFSSIFFKSSKKRNAERATEVHQSKYKVFNLLSKKHSILFFICVCRPRKPMSLMRFVHPYKILKKNAEIYHLRYFESSYRKYRRDPFNQKFRFEFSKFSCVERNGIFHWTELVTSKWRVCRATCLLLECHFKKTDNFIPTEQQQDNNYLLVAS